jgi:polyhydroxyalkanoate synthesis regulator phasin
MTATNETGTTPEQAGGKSEQTPAAGKARKLLLFSYGLAATVLDEGSDLAHKVAEGSSKAEDEGRRLLSELKERRSAARPEIEDQTSEVKAEARQAGGKISKRASAAKLRLTPASKADIDALNNQISRLSSKLDEVDLDA